MPKTDWKIYEIQHRRGPDAPLRTRYQFTDGQGKRRHFATKAKAKIESGKDKALYHQEHTHGKLETRESALELVEARGVEPPVPVC
jgi:hypothetical protein